MPSLKSESSFLQAFQGNQTQTPVWFMRQAGRYLPEYQALKKKYSLNEMFITPDIAAEVTLQPIDILNVDAAILFADILTLPTAMGAGVFFDNKKGPLIDGIDLKALKDIETVAHVMETIALVKRDLRQVPLIGFAGAPFTVLTYLVEGGSSLTYAKTFALMQEQQDAYHTVMRQLTRNTIVYLQRQIEAGVDAVQLFDSWAGILSRDVYHQMVLPYVNEIFSAVNAPSIYFAKNGGHFLPLWGGLEADVISVDHTMALDDPAWQGLDQGVQGNLFNGFLFADDDRLKTEVENVLSASRAHKKYIFNLSHGVLPNVDVEKLKNVVKWVHAFKR